MLNNDLNIFYSGGSGGFYLLHYLLLFKQHWCALGFPPALQHIIAQGSQAQKDQLRLSPKSYADCAGPDWPAYEEYNRSYPAISEPAKSELEALHAEWAANVDYIDQGFDTKLKLVLDHQWNIETTSKWKQQEVFPNNSATLSDPSPRPHKIFFSCMHIDSDIWPDFPGKKVLLYTDINSQLRLAGAKKANWYNHGKRPSITQVKKFLRQSFTVNDQKVYSRVQEHFAAADYIICLQDLIARPEAVLGHAITDQHRQFTQHWKSCHPAELLQKTRLS